MVQSILTVLFTFLQKQTLYSIMHYEYWIQELPSQPGYLYMQSVYCQPAGRVCVCALGDQR